MLDSLVRWRGSQPYLHGKWSQGIVAGWAPPPPASCPSILMTSFPCSTPGPHAAQPEHHRQDERPRVCDAEAALPQLGGGAAGAAAGCGRRDSRERLGALAVASAGVGAGGGALQPVVRCGCLFQDLDHSLIRLLMLLLTKLRPPPLVLCLHQVGGLAEIKAGRIQDILGTLKAERGECSLEHLRGLSTAEVKAELGRFKVSWQESWLEDF